MAEWWSAAGDTRRQFTTLTDGSGAPLDLSGMVPVLRAADALIGRRPRFAKAGVLVQAGTAPNITNQGVVAYDPTAADVAAPGELVCQWQLTDTLGVVRTVPDQAPFIWHIEPKLA